MTERAKTPWLKILLVLAGTYALVYFGGRQSSVDRSVAAATSPSPGYSVDVVSIVCDPNFKRPRAEITIQNLGPEIKFAKAFVSFGGESQSGYFEPTTLPTGAMGDVAMYGSQGASSACGLTAIQDREGRPVPFTR